MLKYGMDKIINELNAIVSPINDTISDYETIINGDFSNCSDVIERYAYRVLDDVVCLLEDRIRLKKLRKKLQRFIDESYYESNESCEEEDDG